MSKDKKTYKNIEEDVFGGMRYLKPEENKRKADMYRNMSVKVENFNFSENNKMEKTEWKYYM